MMLQVRRYVNELMTSNCYVVYDDDSKRCIVIDSASEKSRREIQLIEESNFHLDYIILTHEHTDHNWGVNALREHFPDSKLISSELCDKYIKKTNRAYFLYYFNDSEYRYEIEPADILISNQEESIMWADYKIKFILTPGHSYGSMCIDVEGMLFTGDTIMPYPHYLNKRDGNEEEWEKSIAYLRSRYDVGTIIYPGHGDVLTFGDWQENYYK